MIKLNCPYCGVYQKYEDQYAGQSGACAHCGKPLTVPIKKDKRLLWGVGGAVLIAAIMIAEYMVIDALNQQGYYPSDRAKTYHKASCSHGKNMAESYSEYSLIEFGYSPCTHCFSAAELQFRNNLLEASGIRKVPIPVHSEARMQYVIREIDDQYSAGIAQLEADIRALVQERDQYVAAYQKASGKLQAKNSTYRPSGWNKTYISGYQHGTTTRRR